MGTFLIGVGLMVVGAVLTNVGNNLMSLGHTQQKELDKKKAEISERDRSGTLESMKSDSPDVSILENASESLKSYQEDAKKGTWLLIGTVTFVVGALISFLSFAFAAQSLLAALESTQFVSNVFCAKYIHNEVITRRILFATLTIIIGNVLVVIFSSHASFWMDARDIAHVYIHNELFHIFLIVSGIVFFASYGSWVVYYNARTQKGVFYKCHNLIESMSFITHMSLIGAQAVLHSKNLSMLMQHCIESLSNPKYENQFAGIYRFVTWGELIGWMLAGYLYVNRINLGLSLYPPVYFIPVQAVCFAFFTIVCGGLFFKEFHFTVEQTICFTIGVFLIFVGVCMLVPTDIQLEGKICPITDDLEENCDPVEFFPDEEELPISTESQRKHSLEMIISPALTALADNRPSSGRIFRPNSATRPGSGEMLRPKSGARHNEKFDQSVNDVGSLAGTIQSEIDSPRSKNSDSPGIASLVLASSKTKNGLIHLEDEDAILGESKIRQKPV